MPRGSSFENLYSDYRETHETSSSTINSLGSVRSNQTAEFIGSDRSPNNTDRHYSNISTDPSKNLILSKYFNSTRANNSTYENLCSGCGYGVFEARGKLCNFCQYVINGYLEDSSNIYENICDKCSVVYSGVECSVCSKNNKVNKDDNICLSSSNNKSSSKKLKKRLLHSLLGSLKRVKSFNVVPAASVPNDKASSRKLQIVHNVDGYDNVFRTNETFDLSRICELKRLKSSSSDHHIYGKLRKSDDHLQTCVKQKSQSEDYLIGGTGCETLFRRSTSINSHDSADNETSFYLRQVQNSVGEWMTSLRYETHDYYSFGAPDTVICNPKSIPAVNLELTYNFGASSFCPEREVYTAGDWTDVTSTSEVVRLRSFSNESKQLDFAQQMVNEFKRSLMEKQEAHSNTSQHLRAKRQGIYLKLDGIESKQHQVGNYHVNLVGDQRNCLSPSSAQSQTLPIELTTASENSRRGVPHQLNKRCCIYEKDSEFVSDILQAFDSFLLRESEVVVENNEVISETVEENPFQIVSQREPPTNSESFTLVLPPEINFEAIIQQLALSKSLNKIVLSYVNPLRLFLTGVDQSPHLAYLKFPKLSKKFRRFQVFIYDRRYRHDRDVEHQTSAVSSDRQQQLSEYIPAIDYIPEEQLISNFTETDLSNSAIMTVPNGTKITTSNTLEEEEEPIYQPIWKFKTVGEVQENYITDEYYDHLPRTCDSSSGSIEGVDIEDHDEWEPDDEFTFTTKLDVNSKEADTLSVNTTQSSSGSTITGYASSVSTMTIASTSSVTHHIFRNICIFYSPKEPKIRAVLYEYDRNRCSSYFAPQPPVKTTGWGVNTNGSPIPPPSTTSADYTRIPGGGITSKSSESGCRMFADSVQAWKYMLLDVNYLEDEEDMIVSESQILKAQATKEMDYPPPLPLQRFKSISSGNLLDVPAEEDKKSITERVRNKLQRGVFKLQTRSPKENKKSRNIFRRNEATSLYLEDGMKPKYPIFRAPLELLEMNETSYPDVPRFVVDCIEYIEQKDCIQMDGLYRASGNKVAVDELKQKLVESYIYDPKLLVTDDIHTLTSLLKLFFRELSSPLIPQDTYQRLASTRNLMDPSAIESMKTTFKGMRNPNRATLKFLIKHLTTVAHYSNENRMPASNLAIVWGPCILSANQIEYDIARMNTLAKVLIENYDHIFGDNERLVS